MKTPNVFSCWTALYGCFLTSAFLLWLPGSGYARIVDPKHSVFLASFLVYALGLLALRLRRRPAERVRPLPLLLAGALALTYLISSLLSAYPERVLLGGLRHEGLVTICIYLAIFCAFHCFGGGEKAIEMGIGVALSVNFALICLQWAGQNPLGLYPAGMTFHDRGVRYIGEYLGTIGNSDLLSAFLTMGLLLHVGRYLAEGSRASLFFAMMGWLSVLLTEVLAGLVAVIGALLLFLPRCVKEGVGIQRFWNIFGLLLLGAAGKLGLQYRYEAGVVSASWAANRWVWLLLAMAAICIAASCWRRKKAVRANGRAAWMLTGAMLAGAVAVLIFLFCYRGENETLTALSRLLHGDPPDTLGSGRIGIWKDAWGLIRQHPVWGGGPDTYALRSDFRFSRVTDSGALLQASVDAAHNEYLNTWVNTGLISLLLLLALMLGVLLPAFRRPAARTLPLALACVGYAIHACFGISQSLVTPVFYVLLGCLSFRNGDAFGLRSQSG